MESFIDGDLQDVGISSSHESRMKSQFVEGVKIEEKKAKGKNGLWKEPDFGEWYNKNVKLFVKGSRSKNEKVEVHFDF